jgi:prophage antirepressor-like protein
MSNALTIVKQETFEGRQADVYSDGITYFMTINQLAFCLGYVSKNGIEKLLERNSYLKNEDFSTTDDLSVVEGNRTLTREMRLFTEDGIYEVAFLSKTKIAQAFRAWVRKILKELRQQSQGNPYGYALRLIADKFDKYDSEIADIKQNAANLTNRLEAVEKSPQTNAETVKRIDKLEEKYEHCSAIHFKPVKTKKSNVLDELYTAFTNKDDEYHGLTTGDEEYNRKITELITECIEEMRKMRITDISKRSWDYGYESWKRLPYTSGDKESKTFCNKDYVITKLCFAFTLVYHNGHQINGKAV